MEQKELDFIPWLKKLAERLVIINLYIQQGTDISDADRDLIQALHPLWFQEIMPFYATSITGECQNTIQGDLFNDLLSQIAEGHSN